MDITAKLQAHSLGPDMHPELQDDILAAKTEIERLRAALRFYADPYAWKKENDPDDDVHVPDFYSETSFGDTAVVALGIVEQEGDRK